ncbi:MAG: hypothetical protein WC314_01895 [Vulcanimicrobiota bacterium]
MTARPIIERKALAPGSLRTRRSTPAAARSPHSRFLRRMVRRLKALRAINRVGIGPNAINRDEMVKAWTVSYFLPMLKGKEVEGPERTKALELPSDEELQSETVGVRRVPRPKKGLKLPALFAPCKKHEALN